MIPSIPEILSGRIPANSTILDLGCGTGRHAHALAAAGFRVVAVDADFDAVATGRELGGGGDRSGEHATGGPDAIHGTHAVRPSFVAARAEALPLARGVFAAVICLDVLHWAKNAEAFEAMWRGAWDALRPGGILLVRSRLRDWIPSAAPLADGRYRMESGAEWFLPTLARLKALLLESGAEPPEASRVGNEEAAFILTRKPV